VAYPKLAVAAASLAAALALSPFDARAMHVATPSSTDEARHAVLRRAAPSAPQAARGPITSSDEARASAVRLAVLAPAPSEPAGRPTSTDQARGIAR